MSGKGKCRKYAVTVTRQVYVPGPPPGFARRTWTEYRMATTPGKAKANVLHELNRKARGTEIFICEGVRECASGGTDGGEPARERTEAYA